MQKLVVFKVKCQYCPEMVERARTDRPATCFGCKTQHKRERDEKRKADRKRLAAKRPMPKLPAELPPRPDPVALRKRREEQIIAYLIDGKTYTEISRLLNPRINSSYVSKLVQDIEKRENIKLPRNTARRNNYYQ